MLLTLSGRCGTSVGCGQRIIGRGQGRGKMIPCACAISVSDNTPIKAVNTCPIFIFSSSFRQDCQDCHYFLMVSSGGLKPGLCRAIKMNRAIHTSERGRVLQFAEKHLLCSQISPEYLPQISRGYLEAIRYRLPLEQLPRRVVYSFVYVISAPPQI